MSSPTEASNDPIRGYLEEQFLIEFDDSFPPDTDLFKTGVMDSFGYVQLCRFLERTYHFKFSERDLTGNVLVSLSRMQEFVAAKSEASQASST
jgi:D-alanine--poly(phosphoribitol) ligase subunit 2